MAGYSVLFPTLLTAIILLEVGSAVAKLVLPSYSGVLLSCNGERAGFTTGQSSARRLELSMVDYQITLSCY